MEETGRAALPDPIVDTAAVAVPLLAEVAAPELQARWLPAAISGEALLTTQLAGPLVEGADTAEVVLAARGDGLVAVPRGAVRAQRQPSVDGSRRLFEVDWRDDDVIVVAEGPRRRRRAGPGAPTAAPWPPPPNCSASPARMVDLTVDYVQERRQFGVPIGSFQAVKHHLADAFLRLEFARPVVYAAAWALATGDARCARPGLARQGGRRRRRHLRRPPGSPVPRRHRLHRRVRPAPVPEAGVGPVGGVGGCVLPPP